MFGDLWLVTGLWRRFRFMRGELMYNLIRGLEFSLPSPVQWFRPDLSVCWSGVCFELRSLHASLDWSLGCLPREETCDFVCSFSRYSLAGIWLYRFLFFPDSVCFFLVYSEFMSLFCFRKYFWVIVSVFLLCLGKPMTYCSTYCFLRLGAVWMRRVVLFSVFIYLCVVSCI